MEKNINCVINLRRLTHFRLCLLETQVKKEAIKEDVKVEDVKEEDTKEEDVKEKDVTKVKDEEEREKQRDRCVKGLRRKTDGVTPR